MVHGLSCCDMWDLPGSGIEPVSPALAGGFFTSESPGKPIRLVFFFFSFFLLFSVYLGFPHVFTWIVKKSQALLQEEEEESEAAFSLGSYVLIFVDR